MPAIEPRSLARETGLVYFGYFAAAITGSILVSRKMGAGIAVVCLSDVLYAATTLLFYRLFRSVNRVLALVATALALLGCAADMVDNINRSHAWLSPLLFFGPFCILLGLYCRRRPVLTSVAADQRVVASHRS